VLLRTPSLLNISFVIMCHQWVGLKNIDISNKVLLLAASSARRKYMDYLEGERKKKESTGRGEKRKALDDEIKELKN